MIRVHKIRETAKKIGFMMVRDGALGPKCQANKSEIYREFANKKMSMKANGTLVMYEEATLRGLRGMIQYFEITPDAKIVRCGRVKHSISVTTKDHSNDCELQRLYEQHEHATKLKATEMCFNCGKAGRKLMQCTRCKVALYCGPECQKLHWKAEHKTKCKSLGMAAKQIDENAS